MSQELCNLSNEELRVLGAEIAKVRPWKSAVYSLHVFLRRWWLAISALLVFPFITSSLWLAILCIVVVFLGCKFIIPHAKDIRFPDEKLPHYIARRNTAYDFKPRKQYLRRVLFEELFFVAVTSILFWCAAFESVSLRAALFYEVCFVFAMAFYKNYGAARSFWTTDEVQKNDEYYLETSDGLLSKYYGPIGQLLSSFGKYGGSVLPRLWVFICHLALMILLVFFMASVHTENAITSKDGVVYLASVEVFFYTLVFLYFLYALLKGDESIFALRLGLVIKYLRALE